MPQEHGPEIDLVIGWRTTDNCERQNSPQRGDEASCTPASYKRTVARGDEIIEEWQNLSGTLIVKYANGLITDPLTGAVDEPGYPAWWYQAAGYQYGPRVYDLEDLRATEGLNYTGRSVWVQKNASFEEILELI